VLRSIPMPRIDYKVRSYIALSEKRELEKRVETAYRTLEKCSLCPRQCGVNRLGGEKGFCQVGGLPQISSSGPHFGEEPPLVGRTGSGTIFFTHCNLACSFCQNFPISQLGEGEEITEEVLAQEMLALQKRGCANINFVTPTHFVPQILKALSFAIRGGLNIPLVYNCGGYESVDTLRLVDGVIDIYMPDAKYSDEKVAKKLSSAPGYPDVMKKALLEMHRQVGDLIIKDGVAVRGLLIRHLVLPGGLAGTEEIMHFIAKDLSKDSYVNIMDQYHPEYLARKYTEINRPVTRHEYREAIDIALREGLRRAGGSSERGDKFS